jgi:hypothetical protein
MFFRAVHWWLLLSVVSLAVLLSGCASEESENASVRPWNTPQGWEGGLGNMNTQHR